MVNRTVLRTLTEMKLFSGAEEESKRKYFLTNLIVLLKKEQYISPKKYLIKHNINFI